MFELLINKITPDTLPLNRIIALLGPWLTVAEGAIATWIVTHLHFLSLLHVGHDDVLKVITQLVVFLATIAVSAVLKLKWLKGHQDWADAITRVVDGVIGREGSTTTVNDIPAAKELGLVRKR
jgi:hypothetical protein